MIHPGWPWRHNAVSVLELADGRPSMGFKADAQFCRYEACLGEEDELMYTELVPLEQHRKELHRAVWEEGLGFSNRGK